MRNRGGLAFWHGYISPFCPVGAVKSSGKKISDNGVGLRIKKRRFKQGNSPKGAVKVLDFIELRTLSPL